MNNEICPALGVAHPADGPARPDFARPNPHRLGGEPDFLRLERAAGQHALRADPRYATRANLFADSTVHASSEHLRLMARTVAAVEHVAVLPAFRQRVLAHAMPIAQHPPRCAGVFLGYDFHLTTNGPRLIEINTNAGGPLLNTLLLASPPADPCAPTTMHAAAARIEAVFIAMFREEWRLAQRGGEGRPLRRIAIVDREPAAQYLAPEFELFRHFFEAHGIAALIADPRELSFDGQRLSYRGDRIDLVYNRLTDFVLHDPQHAVLRAAYLADAIVLTPHPQSHALFADKRNLVALADSDWLERIGVADDDREILAATIPQTAAVRPDNAEAFWRSRRQWFFKPAAGFGSKAAYRGDKLTRRVFGEIVAHGGYVAQEVVAAPERQVAADGVAEHFRIDLRNYVYQGHVQLVAARLYRGQTTNFRTPGGGFAAVFPLAGSSRKDSRT